MNQNEDPSRQWAHTRNAAAAQQFVTNRDRVTTEGLHHAISEAANTALASRQQRAACEDHLAALSVLLTSPSCIGTLRRNPASAQTLLDAVYHHGLQEPWGLDPTTPWAALARQICELVSLRPNTFQTLTQADQSGQAAMVFDWHGRVLQKGTGEQLQRWLRIETHRQDLVVLVGDAEHLEAASQNAETFVRAWEQSLVPLPLPQVLPELHRRFQALHFGMDPHGNVVAFAPLTRQRLCRPWHGPADRAQTLRDLGKFQALAAQQQPELTRYVAQANTMAAAMSGYLAEDRGSVVAVLPAVQDAIHTQTVLQQLRRSPNGWPPTQEFEITSTYGHSYRVTLATSEMLRIGPSIIVGYYPENMAAKRTAWEAASAPAHEVPSTPETTTKPGFVRSLLGRLCRSTPSVETNQSASATPNGDRL